MGVLKLSWPMNLHFFCCLNTMMMTEWCSAIHGVMFLFTRMNWSWRWSRAPPCWAVSKSKPAGRRSTSWAQTNWKIRPRWSGEELLHLSVCRILTFIDLALKNPAFLGCWPSWMRQRMPLSSSGPSTSWNWSSACSCDTLSRTSGR